MIINRAVVRMISDPVLSLSDLGALKFLLASFLATYGSVGRTTTTIIRGRTTTSASGLVATVPVSSEGCDCACVELVDVDTVDHVSIDGIDMILVAGLSNFG